MTRFSKLVRCLLVTTAILLVASTAGAEELPLRLDATYRGPDGELVQGTRCATVDDADPSIPRGPADIQEWLERQGQGKAETTINIPVWIHNIYYVSGRNNVGYVTDGMAADQIQVLNDAYNSLGYNFILYGLDRYNSKKYATWDLGSANENLVKQYLAKWPQYVLNIYCIQPPGGLLGWAYFPWSYPQDHYLHGVVALSQSLPGGGAAPYDEGDTITHEVGHWAGLYHTFQGGCFGNGDFVADTPPQATPSYGCPVGKDTCSGGGPDAIHNFMDYSDDFCMYEFTGGQNGRIDWAMSTYRPLMGTVGKSSPSLTAPSRGLPPEMLDDGPNEIAGVDGAGIARGGISLSASPNPFNPRTEFAFSLERPGFVTIHVYDTTGRRVGTVFEGMKGAGQHTVPFDGSRMASGIYHVLMRSGGVETSAQITLVK